MTNTIKRLLLFFLAIPLLIMLILFLPQYNHLGVIILVIVVGVLCGLEMRTMLSGVGRKLPLWPALIPGITPLLAWAVSMGFIPMLLVSALFVAVIIWAFASSIFSSESGFEDVFNGIGTKLIILIYPGWLFWWVARLAWFDNAQIVIIIFMLTVFLNDSHAWFFGMLFGKHRNILAVSPNKSIEGFIGGMLTSVAVILISAHLYPQILPHPLWQLILFGLVTAVTTTMGDLIESAIKRSAGVKDSGNVIPGRGGMLDSMDSILFTAPVFVLFLQMAV